MPVPPRDKPFESPRMKIRRGTLAQTRRVRAHEADAPFEPDEIFDVDPARDHQPPGEAPHPPRREPDDVSPR